MIAKLKKVLYTVDELHQDGDIVVQVADDGLIQAWSISQFRASRVAVRGKHELERMERAVPASVLRDARSLSEALARDKTSALPWGDWRIERLRRLDKTKRAAVAIAQVSDIRQIKKLYTKSLTAHKLYCELEIAEGSIECVGELGKVSIPANLTLPGRIGLNVRYLVEAIKNLVTKDYVGVAIVPYKGTRIFSLASECERHYIVEMRKRINCANESRKGNQAGVLQVRHARRLNDGIVHNSA